MRRAANHSTVAQAVPASSQADIQSCGGGWRYGSSRGRDDGAEERRGEKETAQGLKSP
jgi:hypothetical protein